MTNGIRTDDSRGFNKGRSSKFREGSRVRQTPEEGRRIYRPKRWWNNNKDEDNSQKTLNDKNKWKCFSANSIWRWFILLKYIQAQLVFKMTWSRSQKAANTFKSFCLRKLFRRAVCTSAANPEVSRKNSVRQILRISSMILGYPSFSTKILHKEFFCFFFYQKPF